MKLKKIRAGGFGPLRAQELSLAPGLTVVWGPNEAGKSAWHAACAVALCGLRRARGRLRREDSDFATRHQPWDGGDWSLDAVVTFDQGQQIDVHWDLATRLGRAEDARGRQITSDFLFDGGLDLSVAMGLDRDSFAVTASVRQADVLALLENPALLQEHLQRAAATGGKDATAAAALAAIDTFRKERVGSDRSNSTKPLRAASERLRGAEEFHQDSERRHAERLELVADLQRAERDAELTDQALKIIRQARAAAQLRTEAAAALRVAKDQAALEEDVTALSRTLEQLRSRIELTEAVAALRRAEAEVDREQKLAQKQDDIRGELREAKARSETATSEVRRAEAAASHLTHARAALQLARAEALSDRPTGPPPALEDDDRLALDAASALRLWENRPAPLELFGPTSEDIAASLAALPERPPGDLGVRPEIVDAASTWSDARRSLALHHAARPTAPSLGEDTERELRELAQVIDAPSSTSSLADVVVRARSTQTARRPDPRSRLLAVASVFLLTAGIALAATGLPIIGILLGVAAVAGALISRNLFPVVADPDAPRHLAEVEARLEISDLQEQRRTQAAERADELGLVADASVLREAADDSATSRRTLTKWTELRSTLSAAVETAEHDLTVALEVAGADVTADVASAIQDYEEACRQRGDQSEAARRRPQLEQQRDDRREAEGAASDRQGRRSKAAAGVLTGAAACGFEATSPEDAAEAITAWLAARPARLQALQHARDEERELADLLAGGTLRDLAEQVEQLAVEATNSLGDLALPTDEAALAALIGRLPELIDARQKKAEEAAGIQAEHDERCRVPARVEEMQRCIADATDRLEALRAQQGDALAETELPPDEDTAKAVLQNLRQEEADTAGQLMTLRGQVKEQRRRPRANTAEAQGMLAEAEGLLGDLRVRHPEAADKLDDLGELDAEALADRISELEVDLEEQGKEAAELRGKLDERRRQSPDVAAAEEGVADARKELERVRRLDRTLTLTHEFLAAAQDRVHHDIAPRLTESAGRWLPVVFGSRYDKIRVDPADLAVRAAAGNGMLREATALSHGTAEQLYLLLRVALVEELTRDAKETCPLLLDDITAHFDDERTSGILRMLHELSRERQVVLFTQETRVKNWAQSVAGPDDAVVELAGPRPDRSRA